VGLRLLGDHPGRDGGRRRLGLRAVRGPAAGALRGETFERSILLTMGLSMVLQNGAVFLFTATPHLLESKLSYQNVVVGDFRMPVARLYALGLGFPRTLHVQRRSILRTRLCQWLSLASMLNRESLLQMESHCVLRGEATAPTPASCA
jgi:hypothetical protein